MCQNLDKELKQAILWAMNSPSAELDLDLALQTANAAADHAKSILLSYFGNLKQVSEKDQAGLVSEADLASEKKVVETIHGTFPDHVILGEESGLSSGNSLQNETALQQGAVWMVDPLDGTTNYVHQFPIYCTSIGLQFNGELVVAVVEAPFLNQRFHAVKGRGAFLNGEPIQVSKRGNFGDSLLATGFSVSRKEELDAQIDVVRKVLHRTRGIRRAGAAAYDLCLVAQGVCDGFWEKHLSPWDTAAGTLLVREAGGIVTTVDGKDYNPLIPSIVAASPKTHPELLSILNS